MDELEPGLFQHTEVRPYIDYEEILRELNRRPFAEWPVQKIIDSPQPKLYDGSRAILASRMIPYLRAMMRVMNELDIRIDLARIEFLTETMDQELAVLIDSMNLEPRVTNVLLGYCAGAKKLRKQMFGDGNMVTHDMALGLGAATKIQADVLQLCGFQLIPRKPGSPHPLAHERFRLPP